LTTLPARRVHPTGRKAVEAELSALEVERDVLSRALGAATKQLFGRQQQQQQHGHEAAPSKPRPTVKKARPPSGKALGSSPHASPGRPSPTAQPTGGAKAGQRAQSRI